MARVYSEELSMVQSDSSEFWQAIIKQFGELSGITKAIYARALLDSLGDYALDGDVDQQTVPTAIASILSPHDIEERHSINLRDQAAYGISLRKPKVVEFMKEQGRLINPRTDLKENRYRVFNRRPAVLGNASVFTYAEALYMTNHRRLISVPQELKNYLNE